MLSCAMVLQMLLAVRDLHAARVIEV